MRACIIIGFLFFVSTIGRATVADEGTRRKGVAQSTPSMELFSTLALTEFRLPPLTHQLPESAKEILALFEKLQKTKELDLVQSIRIATVENTEGTVRIGTPTPGGKTQFTAVQFRFAKQDDRILCDLDYQVTRSLADGDNDAQPTITVEFMSTIVLEHGKPTFVGGAFGSHSSFLVATLER